MSVARDQVISDEAAAERAHQRTTVTARDPGVKVDRKWDFTLEGDKDAAKSSLAGQASVNTHSNRRLQEAIALLIDSMPAGAITVKVDGDLGEDGDLEKEHKVTITATSKPQPIEQRVPLTEAEKQAGLKVKREQYQKEDADRQTYIDAGRHTTNDKGELTDINALPVAKQPGESFAAHEARTKAERDRVEREKSSPARR